jgi:hypothetical protein
MNFAFVLYALAISIAIAHTAVADWVPPGQCPSAPSVCDPADNPFACGKTYMRQHQLENGRPPYAILLDTARAHLGHILQVRNSVYIYLLHCCSLKSCLSLGHVWHSDFFSQFWSLHFRHLPPLPLFAFPCTAEFWRLTVF